MKVCVRILVPLLIIILSVFSLFIFRSLPVSRIWKSYQVLYVENDISEQVVLSYLEKNKCSNVISLSSQRQPLYSKITPVEVDSDKTNYLERRLDYFTDGDKKFNLFYIPENSEKQLEKAVDDLVKETKCTAGLDGKSNFPWIVPLVCIIFLIVNCFFANHKKLFIISGVFPVLFSLSQPFYSNAGAVLVLLFIGSLAEPFWHRRNAIKKLSTNIVMIVLLTISIICVSTLSLRSGVLLIISLLGLLSTVYLVNQISIFIEKRSSFSFNLIIPSSLIPVLSKNNNKSFYFFECTETVLLILFLCSARFVPTMNMNGIRLPSPCKETKSFADENMLPSIEDYYEWTWNTITYPYISLNKQKNTEPVLKGDVVKVSEFINTPDGIKEESKTIFEYDNNFISDADKKIDSLDYPAIEKFLKKQGPSLVFYSEKSNGENQGRSGISFLLLLTCSVIPLILYLYYNVMGRKKYEKSK